MQSIVTVGNFDGCHRGHQELISIVNRMKESGSSRSLAVSFSPRPEGFFRGLDPANSLFTDAQKSQALKELGIDEVIIKKFDGEFAKKTHDSFFYDFLVRELGATAICVGSDFCFGFQRKGDANWLRAQAEIGNVRVHLCPPVLWRSEPVSSTRIRRAIAEDGMIEDAAEMLTRPYFVEGVIEKGDQLGRTIGFPTANLGGIHQLLPKSGVYFGYVWASADRNSCPSIMKVPNNTWPAVMNVGTRPTVTTLQPQKRVEAHILSGDIGLDQLYGYKAGFYFVSRLRDEQKFANLDCLKVQIAADIEKAKLCPWRP
jgi:riboflavin kinase/FMN adenylyltransferase